MTDLTNILGDFNPSDYLGKIAYTTSEHPRTAAIKEIQSYGLLPPSSIPYIGRIFRFKDKSDKGKKQSCWAVYYEYTVEDGFFAVCVFGNYKGEPEKIIWTNKHAQHMTTEEQKQLHERIEVATREAEQELIEEQEQAKQECKALWSRLPELSQSEYTKRKQITAKGAKSNNGVLTLAVEVDGEISSLQYIAHDGDKKFHEGGRTKGGYIYIHGENNTTYICEGYATGVSINMATGCEVYACLNAGNIYEFCSWLKNKTYGRIVICADDDYKTNGNPGITKAKKAADVFGFDITIPAFHDEKNRGKDFNDVHCLYGLPELAKQLQIVKTPHEDAEIETEVIEITAENTAESSEIPKIPPGFIQDVYSFYMATSGNHQPGFAIQTALAIASTLCSRYFVTDNDNLSSLFFLNVGKTATGKEHCKKVTEVILRACKFDERIAGDGFTSAGAVMSVLLKKPSCITVTDEFGKYLEAAGSLKNGMQKEGNTALMEAIGRLDGVLRPKNYSDMSVSKKIEDRYIYNPALTLYGLTTPNTFFENIKIDSVLDGFLNRFIVYISDAIRQPRKKTHMIDVPESIKKWAFSIRSEIKKLNSLELSSENPKMKRIFFSDSSFKKQQQFEMKMILLQDQLEKEGLEGLPARANEWSMRLALILALSKNPTTTIINDQDVMWSTNYIESCLMRLLKELRQCMHGSEFEQNKHEILVAISRYPDGISTSEMNKYKPFSHYKKRDLDEILQSLIDGEQIESTTAKTQKRGRPTTLYKKI